MILLKIDSFGGVLCVIHLNWNQGWISPEHEICIKYLDLLKKKKIKVIQGLYKKRIQSEKAGEHESLFQHHRVTQLHTFVLRRCLIPPQCSNVGTVGGLSTSLDGTFTLAVQWRRDYLPLISTICRSRNTRQVNNVSSVIFTLFYESSKDGVNCGANWSFSLLRLLLL